MNYYVSKDGNEVKGPYPLAELRNIVAENELSAVQICGEGQNVWEPLLTVLTAGEEHLASAGPTAAVQATFNAPKKQHGPITLFLSVLSAVILGGGILMLCFVYFERQKANEPNPISIIAKSSLIPHSSLTSPTPYIEAPDYKNFLRVSRRLLTAIQTSVSFGDFHERAVEVISSAEEAVQVAPSDEKRKAVAIFAIAVADADDIWHFKLAHNQTALVYSKSATSRAGEQYPCSNRWDNHLLELIDTYKLDAGNSATERASSHPEERPPLYVFIDSAIQKIFTALSTTFRILEAPEGQDHT